MLNSKPARPTSLMRSAVSASLHRAKLRRPAMPEHYVRRSRLLDLFEEVVRCPLTLVVAPAGTGQDIPRRRVDDRDVVPCAWLSLDDTDCDGVLFWSR